MEEKKGLLDGLFPPRYDFRDMLVSQAEATVKGVELLIEAMKGGMDDHVRALIDLDRRTDRFRHDMERKLQEAFSTSFDRQDIYSVSRQMENVMNFARTTLQEMEAFEVEPDRCMLDMAEHLLVGTREIMQALRSLGSEDTTDQFIERMRTEEEGIEETYIMGMKEVFLLPDHMIILKKREIYHHIKDAGRALSATADILHRAAFGID